MVYRISNDKQLPAKPKRVCIIIEKPKLREKARFAVVPKDEGHLIRAMEPSSGIPIFAASRVLSRSARSLQLNM